MTKELAFDFQRRQHGKSKLQLYVLWLLLCDVASKLSGGMLPPRLISFVGVGLIGSIGHFSVLYASLALGLVFWLSQAVATVVAMVFNFAINNVLTYLMTAFAGRPSTRGCCSTVSSPPSASSPMSARRRSPTSVRGPYLHGGLDGPRHRHHVEVRRVESIDLGPVVDPERAGSVGDGRQSGASGRCSGRRAISTCVASSPSPRRCSLSSKSSLFPSKGSFILAALPTAAAALVLVHAAARAEVAVSTARLPASPGAWA